MGIPVSGAAENLLYAWDFDPSVMIGCVALLSAYAIAHRGDFARAGWFVAGVVAMFLALVSPIDVLSDSYLFSAHMLQHLILVLIVPPLLILGISPRFARAVLRIPLLARIERLLGNALVAWTIGMTMLWIWHLPALYNATLADEGIHIFEHLCFLVSATVYWWPILAPVDEARLSAMPAIIYLVTGAVANSVLAILLTFARVGLYPAYLNPEDSLKILPLVRDSWGLTPALDQQLGGLMMWIPGGMVFLAAVIWVMARWYTAPESKLRVASAS